MVDDEAGVVSAQPSSSPTSNSSSLNTITSLHHIVTVKLTHDNYLLWKGQMAPYLHGQHLFRYVDGTISPPSLLLTGTTQNPSYTHWFQQDQLILSALISSLSENIIAQVIGLPTSRSIWLALESLFASRTQARLGQLHFQLATLKKGFENITDYFCKTKLLADTMAAAGKPLSAPKFNSYLLAGLGTEFDSLVTSVTTRLDPPSSEELYSHLITHEARLNHQAVSLLSTEITANISSKSQPSHFRGGGPGKNRGRGDFRGKGRGRGGSPPQFFTEERLICQVCYKTGHTALHCYNRFNQSFQAPPPPSFTAHYSSVPAVCDSSWYPDSAATNHMTNDFSNLTIQPSEYFGEDQVWVGDGSALPIHHIGNTNLPTPHDNLLLHNLSHVPLLTKNLLSVRQFCEDNMVFFEFHSSFFCVKDLRTGKILLQGLTSNGLYTLPASGTSVLASHSTPQVSVGERTSPSHWHQRLGHPSLSIVRHLLHRFQLPVKPLSTASGLCSACYQAKSHSLPFPRSTTVTTRPLQLLFLDVWGPAPMVSRDGFRYYLSIVDAFSRYTWLFPLQCKSDVYNTFVVFTKTVERFFSLQISSVQSDWGGEFRSLHRFLLSQGISHRSSCPHIHQQNGVIERKHKHIVESGLALLAHASLPKRFWIDAFKTAVYLINRLPNPVITNQSPYFLLFHKHPDYNSLRMFGFACYPHLRPYSRHKLDFRSALCFYWL
ncbi:Retrovirus-related Pol polyprotein from transposon TNT 1-94 [Morella rubra]|uniref:Retrovirus-related Pol polyprotein from transposon TNT 1-94 n=1 Tax=Morella rubra TaxID=262757 RepID=A0A6A1VKW1_9ROSI|nr:Retrovirus-related Pol polyprotein from transposon TNT 1-94 [Morella rubra]